MTRRRPFMVLVTCALMLSALTLVSAPSASAQNKVRAAKRAFASGYTALHAGKYGEALAHYERSYRLAPRPRTLFNIGVCQEELSRTAAAWRSYRAFLRQAHKRDGEIVVQARARIARISRQLTGTLTILSNPAGAVVRIDGKRISRGRTPLTLLIAPGKHVVRVSLSGAVPVERSVNVVPDKTRSVTMALALASAITIRAHPRDSVITRKGQDAQARGTYEAQVRPGAYKFTIRRRGYVTQYVRVRAVAGRTYEQQVRLRRDRTGGSFVLVGAGGATVTLDGKRTRKRGGARANAARVTFVKVPSGHHQLRAVRPGHAPWNAKLHLSPGELVMVDLHLAKTPSRRSRWGRWGAVGLGVAGMSAGAFLGIRALQDAASDSASRHDRGNSRALIADGLFAVGIAGIITAWRLSKHASSTANIRRARRKK